MNTAQTPLELLQSRKAQLRFEADVEKEKITTNLKYLQEHGGRLAWNSVKSAVFPSRSSGTSSQSKPSMLPLTLTDLALGGVSTLMKGNTGILPIAMNFAKPFLLTWGIKGAKKLIGGFFSRKKKKKK